MDISMRRAFFLLSTVFIMCFPCIVFANTAPSVSNITVSQRTDGSGIVDIYYTLSDADDDRCTISVLVSNDGGSTWTITPSAPSLSGDVTNVLPGTGSKHITWNSKADLPGTFGSDYLVKVTADDNTGLINMVYIAAGEYINDTGTSIHVDGFYIGKYEVTNQQYCDYLNDDDPIGTHYTGSQDIIRSGTSGSYTYSVISGRENWPADAIHYYDALAYITWLSSKDGYSYRLPNQYEWQKAAGWNPVLQKLWIYGFQSDSIDRDWCNYNNYYWGRMTVGTFNGTMGKHDAQSYYGCYDMSGNIWEWTTEKIGYYNVLRGGCWDSLDSDCTVTDRLHVYQSTPYRYYGNGFRVVRD